MLLTEEQARAKWCPHARTSWDGSPTYNRDSRVGTLPPSTLCVASECMSWRWARYPSVTLDCEEEADFGAKYHDDAYVRRELPNGFIQYTPNNGFCGIAGKVEG